MTIIEDDSIMIARATLLADRATKYMPDISPEILQTTAYLQTPITFAVRDYMASVMEGRPEQLSMAAMCANMILSTIRVAYILGYEAGSKALPAVQAGFHLAPEPPPLPSTDPETPNPAAPPPA